MRLPAIVAIVALFAAAPALVAQRGAAPKVANPVVIQFMVDGIDHNSVRTAIAAGATTLGSLLKQGVVADTYYCTSPAPRCASRAADASPIVMAIAVEVSFMRDILMLLQRMLS